MAPQQDNRNPFGTSTPWKPRNKRDRGTQARGRMKGSTKDIIEGRYVPNTNVIEALVTTRPNEARTTAQSQQTDSVYNTGQKAPGRDPELTQYPSLGPAGRQSSTPDQFGGDWSKRSAAISAPPQGSASSQGPPVHATSAGPNSSSGDQRRRATAPTGPSAPEAPKKGKVTFRLKKPVASKPAAGFGQQPPTIAHTGPAAPVPDGRPGRPSSRASSIHSQESRANSSHAGANTGTPDPPKKVFRRIPNIRPLNPASESGYSHK